MIGHTGVLFNQMIDVLDTAMYTMESSFFENESIGKHFRQTTNFYDALTVSYHKDELCYERQKREPLYEGSPETVSDKLKEILNCFFYIEEYTNTGKV